MVAAYRAGVVVRLDDLVRGAGGGAVLTADDLVNVEWVVRELVQLGDQPFALRRAGAVVVHGLVDGLGYAGDGVHY